MYVYAIRSIHTSHFYGFTRVTKSDACVTKVPYFHTKRDAEKFASFLTLYEGTPQLYEYEDTGNHKAYVDDYCIYRMSDSFLQFMLGMHGIGFHECTIRDDTVCCVQTGMMDFPPIVKGTVLESAYNRDN